MDMKLILIALRPEGHYDVIHTRSIPAGEVVDRVDGPFPTVAEAKEAVEAEFGVLAWSDRDDVLVAEISSP